MEYLEISDFKFWKFSKLWVWHLYVLIWLVSTNLLKNLLKSRNICSHHVLGLVMVMAESVAHQPEKKFLGSVSIIILYLTG